MEGLDKSALQAYRCVAAEGWESLVGEGRKNMAVKSVESLCRSE